MRTVNHIEHGVCPECEDPHGFGRCSECSAEAEGVYDDTDDSFLCYACCWREAESQYDYRYERAPEPEDWEMPF